MKDLEENLSDEELINNSMFGADEGKEKIYNEEYGKGRQELYKFKTFYLHVSWWKTLLNLIKCPCCNARMITGTEVNSWYCPQCFVVMYHSKNVLIIL